MNILAANLVFFEFDVVKANITERQLIDARPKHPLRRQSKSGRES